MPSAAWIAASKKTPMQPVFYVACESVDAINVTQKLASDWNAGAMTNLDVFALPGGGAGLRPKLYTYNQNQVTWTDWYELPFEDGMLNSVFSSQGAPNGGQTPWFNAPVPGFLESVVARWRVRYRTAGDNDVYDICGWPAVPKLHYYNNLPGALTIDHHVINMLRLGQFAQGASVPVVTTVPNFHDVTFGMHVAPRERRNIYPYQDADFTYNYRAKTGSITTKVFDLGTVPNVNSRIFIEDMVTGSSSISYVCEGSATGVGGWVSLGSIADGREVPPYRYYRITATFVSTGYDTPELYSIRIVGGNQQEVHLGTHRGEPVLPSGEVQPYLQKVSSISSKISLKDKATVGDLTLDLAWMPLTSDLVQSTGKRRSVTVYLGFKGLAREDYEPYFTGVWESYTADQDKRTFSVKLRDVWKKFKKKIPEQQNNGGVRVDIYHQFGRSPSGAGSVLNIIDAIVQVADMAKAPDRFIDRAGLSSLKAAKYSGAEWNVYRVLTDQKDSDDLLKELSITAGLFLYPMPDGKLTPLHYDTLAAATPAVTLDAGQIKFTNLVPDMAETVTRHNVYFNLIEDSQGRRSGGSPTDYSNDYTTVGSTSSVIAERDREEAITGEWFDNWGLAAGAANGVPNPLTQLADRLESWYTPVATVNGKQVSTTKVNVRAENVPLRYWSDVMPGKTVLVDNLRLPCPVNSWGGFSDQVKFLVMSWNVDPKNYTISLELFQIAPLEYNATPTWNTYDPRDLVPQVTSLSVVERQVSGADGILRPQLAVSFVPPVGYTSGAYEVWISDGTGVARLFTTIPAAHAGESVMINVPAITGVGYVVSVSTVTPLGDRLPLQESPAASITPGLIAQITSDTLKLLNPEAKELKIDDFLNGRGDFSDVVDTFTPAAGAGVGQEGAFATKGQMVMRFDRQILLKAGTEYVNSQVSLLNDQIQLKASSQDLSAQVTILSDAIGAKLNASGTVGPGMLISWTDETHTRSVIDFASDTFRISKPDGSGVKPIFTVGTVNGVSTVGINAGDLIVDGSILARHIAADQLIVGTNVTMGPDAYIEWSNVQSKPTNLAGLDSAAATKLSGIASGATVGADWNTNVVNKPTIPTVPSYITSTKITATTIESPAISAGTFTGSQFILGNGTAYGKIETYDFANRSAGIQILDGVNPSVIVKGGVFTGSTLQTAASGERFTVDSTSKSAKFFDSAGNVKAWIGTASLLNTPYTAYGVFGSDLSTESRTALMGISDSGHGVYGLSKSGRGMIAVSTNQIGLEASGGMSPLLLDPSTSSAAPSHFAPKGSLWVTSAGVLYINLDSGITWQKVGAQ
jgi:hypothetical protein